MLRTAALLLLGCTALLAADGPQPENFLTDLKLVQEIDCGVDPTVLFKEVPEKVSRTQKLIDAGCRVLPNEGDRPKYFAYRIGQGKGLKAGGCYVLNIEFPDDKPRSFCILNWGCETASGVATGTATGDALKTRYVNNNSESLKYPQTQRLLQWRSVFHLHDRTLDLKRPRNPAIRPLLPADGFWVIVAQFASYNDPLSAGAAVSKIRLFEVPDETRLQAKLTLPPEGLPRRHVFWREEMADGVIAQGHKPEEKDEKLRGVKNPVDWYEFKAKLMKTLGIDTFCRDLLEFGHNQGWDSTEGGGNHWFYQSSTPKIWEETLAMLGKYDFDVLPYYEYAGSVGQQGLGNQGRCRTLAGKDTYTHISWTEKRNVDFADPAFLPDAKRLLDLTIGKFKDKVRFVGAWFRPRPSANPISFNDLDLSTFAKEANDGRATTRQELAKDRALLNTYYAWWFGKRKDFLVALRDHLRQSVSKDAVLLYTTDTSEPGVSLPASIAKPGEKEGWKFRNALVTDDVTAWDELLKGRGKTFEGHYTLPFERVVAENLHLKAQLAFRETWAQWEWQHACPPPDPARYKDGDGVLMTCTFNRLYTVSAPETFEPFRTASGLAAIRHYPLNENDMTDGKDDILGYFVCDVERAGPFCMLAEARAVAYGDPRYLGYLMGNNYQRGFPEYVRAFNAAFLALPALPSVRLADACADPDVVVRAIETPNHGTYLAVVNVAMTPKENVAVKLPKAGKASDAVTGAEVNAAGGPVTLSLYPGQLRALHIQ